MAKQGTLIAVAEDQEGKNPKIVTPDFPFPVILRDQYGNPIHVDQYSGALGTIEQEHLKIHEGLMWQFFDEVSIPDASGTQDYLLEINGLSFPHFSGIEVSSLDAGDFRMDLYKESIVSDNGTEVSAHNYNQNSDNTPTTKGYKSPIITDIGTLIDPVLVPGTKKVGNFGSSSSNEWNLKNNTKSVIRITNLTTGGGSSAFLIKGFFYE